MEFPFDGFGGGRITEAVKALNEFVGIFEVLIIRSIVSGDGKELLEEVVSFHLQ